jgi:tetratricopeptide (TPR) repeat protein
MAEELENEVLEVKETQKSESTKGGFINNVFNFFEEKQQLLAYVGGGLVVVIGVAMFVFAKWLPDRNVAAQKASFRAELAFAKDSFALALNGNGADVKGFLEIGNKFSFTKTANLSHYYAGICYLNLKQYDNAVKYLGKFNTSDPILGAVRYSALGDAYSELGKMDDAISNYEKAASFSANEVYTPYFLLKAALANENQKQYGDAKELLEKIKTNYPTSDEGRDIEKYLARVNAAL